MNRPAIRTARRQAFLPLSCLLALATAVTLLGLAQTLAAPTVWVGATDPQVDTDVAVVRQFYAAVNAAIATGDDAPLAALLATDFADHAPLPGAPPDRAGLLGAVRALRAIAPGLRLAVLDLVAQGDRVAVRVGVGGDAGPVFLGIPVPAARLWGTTDLFRVAGGQVVEHWSDPTGLASFAPLATVAVPVDPLTRKAITLERWTFAPGAAETRVTDEGFLVLLGESGRLTVDFGGRAPGAAPVPFGPPVAPRVLGPGDALAVPYGWRFTLANEGEAPAVVLAVAAVVPTPNSSAEAAGGVSAGVDHAVLAWGPTADLPGGAATVAVGRALLGPGAALPAHRVGVAELAAVEAGTLALTADGGSAWVAAMPNGPVRWADPAAVDAGGGVLVEAGTAVSYQPAADRSVALLLVVVGPAGDDPAPASASATPA